MYTNKKGVSNTVIAVLIVVALMVVVAGTILILGGTEKVNEKAAPVNSIAKESGGLIQLNVVEPKVKKAGAIGLITLNVE
jgi:hypothetical protein